MVNIIGDLTNAIHGQTVDLNDLLRWRRALERARELYIDATTRAARERVESLKEGTKRRREALAYYAQVRIEASLWFDEAIAQKVWY